MPAAAIITPTNRPLTNRLRRAATLWARHQHGDLVTLAAEFADSGEWALDGSPTASHWLATIADVETCTTREWIRLGRALRALRALPATADAFAHRLISYAKARTLTRLATPANETELLDIAHTTPANHLGPSPRRLAQPHQRPLHPRRPPTPPPLDHPPHRTRRHDRLHLPPPTPARRPPRRRPHHPNHALQTTTHRPGRLAHPGPTTRRRPHRTPTTRHRPHDHRDRPPRPGRRHHPRRRHPHPVNGDRTHRPRFVPPSPHPRRQRPPHQRIKQTPPPHNPPTTASSTNETRPASTAATTPSSTTTTFPPTNKPATPSPPNSNSAAPPATAAATAPTRRRHRLAGASRDRGWRRQFSRPEARPRSASSQSAPGPGSRTTPGRPGPRSGAGSPPPPDQEGPPHNRC